MYARLIKRPLGFLLSAAALIVLSPVLLVLTLLGAFKMKGNPFFTQDRPGYHEKIFKLIKYRTMSNEKDRNGKLLPDEKRLNGYGRFLRSTSLDELPELVNIVKGDMAIIGPRPLIPEYLPYYTDEERHRHDVRPGLTGLAQVSGRSFLSWEEIFGLDLEYVRNISFLNDVKIIGRTLAKVVGRKDVADLTTAHVGKDGRKYIVVDGHEYALHQPLNVERAPK